MRTTLVAIPLITIALTVLGASTACTRATGDGSSADSAARAAAMRALTRDTGARASPSADTTGLPDLDLLRRMVDHHHGLIVLERAIADRKDASPDVRSEARRLATSQGAEMDSMGTILERALREHHTPTLLPTHQATNDSVLATTGVELDRRFRGTVIARHREAIAMIDEYAPRLQHATFTRMMRRVRETESREIAELEKRTGTR
ncbi:MAG: DUF305 domain-containing protein [Gemmatimonadaceae bacterium]